MFIHKQDPQSICDFVSKTLNETQKRIVGEKELNVEDDDVILQQVSKVKLEKMHQFENECGHADLGDEPVPLVRELIPEPMKKGLGNKNLSRPANSRDEESEMSDLDYDMDSQLDPAARREKNELGFVDDRFHVLPQVKKAADGTSANLSVATASKPKPVKRTAKKAASKEPEGNRIDDDDDNLGPALEEPVPKRVRSNVKSSTISKRKGLSLSNQENDEEAALAAAKSQQDDVEEVSIVLPTAPKRAPAGKTRMLPSGFSTAGGKSTSLKKSKQLTLNFSQASNASADFSSFAGKKK